jgi:hypothetical protein
MESAVPGGSKRKLEDLVQIDFDRTGRSELNIDQRYDFPSCQSTFTCHPMPLNPSTTPNSHPGSLLGMR